ncbi:MAG TPA: DUF1302 domain-containing protein [Rubrivivax sp.]|nr:DUF1302 domain-containing protein [Rubrivivax sp.]
MTPRTTRALRRTALAALAACGAAAQAFTFDAGGGVRGNFDSTITAGLGVRAGNPSCSLVGDLSYCDAADIFRWGSGDDGNLNYRSGDFFTGYIKGNHELFLNMPDGWKFLGRINWLHDAKADDTARTPLSSAAKGEIVNDVRVLDLWLGKTTDFGGGRRFSVRVGNQFLNWGESLFLPGGINSPNAIDIQRLSQPGLQLKEAFLAEPMINVSGSFGNGVSAEAYYQLRWNRTKFPPVGGYWSPVDLYDKGKQPIYLGPDPASAAALGEPEFPSIPFAADDEPSDSGQWGVALRWQPRGSSANWGFYALNYHDKLPNLRFINGQSEAQWTFLEDRKLYGASVSFPLGNWAIGTELSYRPKDAMALSSCFDPAMVGDNVAGFAPAGECHNYIDGKRWQMHVTGLLSLTPGDHGGFLDLLGADTATLLAEAVFIHYPDMKKVFLRNAPDGTPVAQLPAAGLWNWSDDGGVTVYGAGSKTSWGFNFDFSWVYDGSIIPGWQVTPGIYHFQALAGRTPNLAANFMKGARVTNFYLLVTQNPANWQIGMNYAVYGGGKNPFDQPLGDRDFFGMFVSRNF